jgi:uracil-DNA glycosylase family 4
LIVIGASPGYHEHLHDAPFMGNGGRLLRDVILAELYTLCTIYLTNLVRCGREPDAKSKDYKSCFPHHLEDMRQILETPHPAHYVLLLGAPATVQFHRLHLGLKLRHSDAIAQNGRHHTVLGRSVPVFTTLHPGAVLLNNSLIHNVEDHVNLLISTIRGEAPAPTEPDIQPARSPHHLP